MKKLVGVLFAAMMVMSTICTPAFAASYQLRPEVSPHFTNITGYIGGYEDGSMRPNGTLTRVEMMQVVSNLMHNYSGFSDNRAFTPSGTTCNIYDINDANLYWADRAIAQVLGLKVFTTNFYRGFEGTNPGYETKTKDEVIHATYSFLGMSSIPMGSCKYTNYTWISQSKYPEEVRKFLSYGWEKYVDGVDCVVPGRLSSLSTFLSAVNQMLPAMYAAGLSDNPAGNPRLFSDNEMGDWDTFALLRPTAPMTREEMALVLYRLTDKSAPATISTFSDTKNLAAESNTAIAVLSSNGVIKGYPDGSFQPAGTLTRAEAITMINRFFSDRLVANPNHTFHPWDIKGHWAEAEINRILK